MRMNSLGVGLADINLANRAAAADALRRGTSRLSALLRLWRRRRLERRELTRLDSRMLKDIGLTRTDAEFLINKPFWRE